MILIPGGDPGDKQTVAFGASENSRPIGYLRSPVSVLVSHSWCRKMTKAGSCRSTDVTSKTAKRQSVQWHRPMQDFVYEEDFCPF